MTQQLQLQPKAIENVRLSRMSGEAIATIFERMLRDVDVLGIKATEITLDFQDYDVQPAVGDMIPVIVLALRPAQSEPDPDTLMPEKSDQQ